MNRVQLYGRLLADPEIRINKSGAMSACLMLETHSAWQVELGQWRYSPALHHITVYKEKLITFLQDEVRAGAQLVVQGLLTYGDSGEAAKGELSHNKKRYIHIIIPRQNGLIFQVTENQNLPKTKPGMSPSLPFHWESILETGESPANENKSPKNLDETEKE